MHSFPLVLRTILSRPLAWCSLNLKERVVWKHKEKGAGSWASCLFSKAFRDCFKTCWWIKLPIDSAGCIFKWKQRVLRLLFHKVFKWLLRDAGLTHFPLIYHFFFFTLLKLWGRLVHFKGWCRKQKSPSGRTRVSDSENKSFI